MDYAISVENLSKRYADFFLDGVIFHLPYGCIMGLIGENGAGKTTTIKLILDLIRRQSGSISVLGRPCPEELDLIKEHLGVILEESSFPENLSARYINQVLKNIYRTWDEKKFHSLLSRLSLPTTKNIKDYSRGMKTKLAVAVALAHDAQLLILDEPTSGLDPVVREEILEIFMEFIQDESHSILMSTHIVSDLEKVADYVTFLHQGKIIFSQGKDDLLESFALVKCSPEEFQHIDPSAVRGYRKNSFGVEALVLKDKVRGDYVMDPAGIEEIMLYHIKKERVS